MGKPEVKLTFEKATLLLFFEKLYSTTRTEFIIIQLLLKVKLNDKLKAFLFCEALLSCNYYDAKHYYAAASIITMQSINTSVTIVTTTLSFHERTILTTTLFTSVL